MLLFQFRSRLKHSGELPCRLLRLVCVSAKEGCRRLSKSFTDGCASELVALRGVSFSGFSLLSRWVRLVDLVDSYQRLPGSTNVGHICFSFARISAVVCRHCAISADSSRVCPSALSVHQHRMCQDWDLVCKGRAGRPFRLCIDKEPNLRVLVK